MKITGHVLLDNLNISGGTIVWVTNFFLGSYDTGGASNGIPVSYTVLAHGLTTVTYELTSGILPPDLTLNTSTGEISGMGKATLPLDYVFEITAHSGPLSLAKSFKITATNTAGGDPGN